MWKRYWSCSGESDLPHWAPRRIVPITNDPPLPRSDRFCSPTARWSLGKHFWNSGDFFIILSNAPAEKSRMAGCFILEAKSWHELPSPIRFSLPFSLLLHIPTRYQRLNHVHNKSTLYLRRQPSLQPPWDLGRQAETENDVSWSWVKHFAVNWPGAIWFNDELYILQICAWVLLFKIWA